MGLSNAERYSGIITAVDKMTKIGKSISTMRGLTDKLWHATIGNNSNNSYWILGGSTACDVKIDGTSVWEQAIVRHTEDALPKQDDEEVKDSIQNQLDHSISIHSLVMRGSGIVHAHVFDLYQWSESLSYYLRRYNDKMLRDFKNLDVLISDIQGACFSYFKTHDVFAKAYIVNKVCQHLLGEWYPYREEEWNDLTKWMVHQNIHFSLAKCMDMDLGDLALIHKSIVEDGSMKNKVICLSKMLGGKLHKYRKDKFMKKYISKSMFDKSEKMVDDVDKIKQQSELSLYGWSYYN